MENTEVTEVSLTSLRKEIEDLKVVEKDLTEKLVDTIAKKADVRREFEKQVNALKEQLQVTKSKRDELKQKLKVEEHK